jgi:hypothetical protein
MTTDHELTPEQLEAVSGGLIGLGIAAFYAALGLFVGEDHTPTNISNGVMTLLNNPPPGW